MKRAVIVQARMGSTRLPGKVLLDLAGQPMLFQQLRRLQQCRLVDEIVVATSTKDDDTPVVEVARKAGVQYFRGSEQDVLTRFVGAAKQAGADIIARITADCPLIDPDVGDWVLGEYLEHIHACDYASNVLVRRTFPRGLDFEVFSFDTLLRMDRLATSTPAREHVTVYLRSERPDLFLLHPVLDEQDNSDLRWTVDTAEDMEFVRKLFADLDLDTQKISYRDLIQYVRTLSQSTIRFDERGHTWDPLKR